ncbi:SpoIIE family protein phosphatase [Streptomyces sp. 35G-GA-8]|uniref:SpoIIE family protein phosphatase n=1 Tax=Streptomyces sp. 35G-GA-8 TaxID=2939434 RepID=UPI0027E5BE03|nr:SpoIIE family protein phosphatase [Streptomyces sp. 35G-GA-8]
MADRGALPAAVSLPDDWPAHPDLSLALNRMGSFDWDIDSGLLHLNVPALQILGLRPEEYDGSPRGLARRLSLSEAARLKSMLARALKEGSAEVAAYFRIVRRDGSRHWARAQAHIAYDGAGRPRRIIGLLRNAEHELTEVATRSDLHEARRRMAGVVERTTVLLARAETVEDVLDVLRDEEALGHLKAVSVMLGVVEGGRIRTIAEGRAGSYVPELKYTRIDGQFPMSEVVRTQRPRFITSREDFRSSYPLLWPHVEPLSVASGAYLPLIAQGRMIGAMGLLYPRHGGFTAEERNLLVALSSGIAQSLQRAILYEQEHSLSEDLQRAMLPRRVPEVPGARSAFRYRSARLGRSVGGDWYDVLPLPGDRVGLTIGDVQGHDTDAAVVMGQLRMALWAYAAEGHPPDAAMARASALLRELGTDRFATCTYVEVDLLTGELRIVRAGHLDPLVRRADGGCHWIETSGGLPLGLSTEFPELGGVSYPVTTGVLGPGETLLLCTDGLVEQPGIDLGESLEGLRETVRTGPADLEELADLLFAVERERSGGDDMALLLLRRDGV